MIDTLDIIAATNPAYCSLVLLSFIDAYTDASGIHPNACLSFLAVPIAMSSEINGRFRGTNVKTGLLKWVERNPDLRLLLPDLVRHSASIVRASILFGLQTGLLEVREGGGLEGHAEKVGGSPKDRSKAEITQPHRAAARSFGAWCGRVRSASTVFASFGIMP